jgi:hypothetical protein
MFELWYAFKLTNVGDWILGMANLILCGVGDPALSISFFALYGPFFLAYLTLNQQQTLFNIQELQCKRKTLIQNFVPVRELAHEIIQYDTFQEKGHQPPVFFDNSECEFKSIHLLRIGLLGVQCLSMIRDCGGVCFIYILVTCLFVIHYLRFHWAMYLNNLAISDPTIGYAEFVNLICDARRFLPTAYWCLWCDTFGHFFISPEHKKPSHKPFEFCWWCFDLVYVFWVFLMQNLVEGCFPVAPVFYLFNGLWNIREDLKCSEFMGHSLDLILLSHRWRKSDS